RCRVAYRSTGHGRAGTTQPRGRLRRGDARRQRGSARQGARGVSWRRLGAVVVKELRQLRRDRITLAMIVGIPVMQLLLFGYAINTNRRSLRAGIDNQADTAGSRALVLDLLATGVVAPVAEVDTPQQLMAVLKQGRIGRGIVV